jgi:prepilin-type processing-associated H-X9-DG protein
MSSFKTSRDGKSLIELLVVFAIIGIFSALALSTIQKTRKTAFRISTNNKLKNIALSVLQINDLDNKMPLQPGQVFTKVASHLNLEMAIGDNSIAYFPYFLETVDPTYQLQISNKHGGNTSYAINPYMLNSNLSRITTDGLSNTMIITERYAQCHKKHIHAEAFYPKCYDNSRPVKQIPCGCSYVSRTATFGDAFFCDFDGTNKIFQAGIPAFQDLPTPENCDPRYVQAFFESGLNIAMADGSVHILNRTVSTPVFVALMTHNKNDQASIE